MSDEFKSISPYSYGKAECPMSPIQNTGNNEVPEALAKETYKEYSAQGRGNQSFEELNSRGGFGVMEMMILLYSRCKRLEHEIKMGTE